MGTIDKHLESCVHLLPLKPSKFVVISCGAEKSQCFYHYKVPRPALSMISYCDSFRVDAFFHSSNKDRRAMTLYGTIPVSQHCSAYPVPLPSNTCEEKGPVVGLGSHVHNLKSPS